MTNYLFPRFEIDRSEYENLAAYWLEQVWARVPEEMRQEWQVPWFSERPIALQDGNPIFTAWAPTRRLGLTVIQVPPGAGEDEPRVRIDWFGGEPYEPDAIRRLTIVCVLTDRNWRSIVDLLKQWVQDGRIIERRRSMTIADSPRFLSPGYQLDESYAEMSA